MRCLVQGWIQTPEPTGEKKKKRFIPTILYIYHKNEPHSPDYSDDYFKLSFFYTSNVLEGIRQ